MAPRKHLTEAESAFLEDLRLLLLSRPAEAAGLNDRSPDQIFTEIKRMARAMILAPPSLTDMVGPVCVTGQATAWLGVSRQALHKAVKENRVVALQSQDGKWFYPTWQFSRTGLGSDLVAQVLDTLRSGMSPLQAASWFVSPCPELGNITPVQYLDAQSDSRLLMRAAACAVRPLRADGGTASFSNNTQVSGGAKARGNYRVGHSAHITTTQIGTTNTDWM